VRTRIGYPSPQVEKQLLLARKEDTVEDVEPTTTLEELVAAQHEVDRVAIDPSVLDYAQAIVTATRQHDGIAVGVSTRGAKAFLRAACARALVHGRGYLLPDDLSEMAVPVLSHRLRLVGSDAGLNVLLGEGRRDDAERVIRDLVSRIDVPL
jgi:MoxR-like ATPase